MKARRRIPRWATMAVAISLIAALGTGLRWHELGNADKGASDGPAARSEHAEAVARLFRQGVVMLHAREYEHAALAFERVLTLTRLPEAQVNMGYAMLGLGRVDQAKDYFNAAIDQRPSQRNAYYGLAEALEALGDTAGARGAMRTFVHLSPANDPFLRKARAALWEWQAASADTALGRQPGNGGVAQ